MKILLITICVIVLLGSGHFASAQADLSGGEEAMGELGDTISSGPWNTLKWTITKAWQAGKGIAVFIFGSFNLDLEGEKHSVKQEFIKEVKEIGTWVTMLGRYPWDWAMGIIRR